MSTILTPNHQFRFLTLPTSQVISKPTKSLSIPDKANFPFSFTGTTTTQNFIQFTLKNNLSPPNPQQLHYWGCHDLLNALDAYPNATIAYTDGSDDPTVNTPSGAAITFNTTPPTTICNTSPVKGSYLAEIYAIILFTYLQHLDTLSQPIIFAIDNLSVCPTLHQIQQLKSKPFASNAHCSALWYNYIWEFLHNTHLHIIFTWIKGHADFDGNEHSDKMSKWVSLNLHQHPEHHNPDTYTTIIHHCQDALHAKLSNTHSQAINTTTYTYLLAPTSTPTHRDFPDYLLNGQTDCTVALVFFPITNSTHINAQNATLITPSTP